MKNNNLANFKVEGVGRMDKKSEPPPKKQRTGDANTSQDNIRPDDQYFSEDVDPSGDRFMVNEDKYANYVTAEELDKLREFKVLDEVRSDDEDTNEEGSESSDGIPEEEIEKMLEEGLPEDFKGAPKPKEKPYFTKKKVVLEEKGVNQFEVLPLDWMMVRHYSGMPVYMHRASRVCTLAKPYFLGKGNTRRHDIPISAIPCLAYRRALLEEEKQKVIDKQIEEQIKSGRWQQNSDRNKQVLTNILHKNNTGIIRDDKEKTRCPYLHAKGIKQNSDKMPEDYEELKKNVKNTDTNESTSKESADPDEANSVNNCKVKQSSNASKIIDQPKKSDSHKELVESEEIEKLSNAVKEQESLHKDNAGSVEIVEIDVHKIGNLNENQETVSQKESSNEVYPYEIPLTNGLKTEEDVEISESTSQSEKSNNQTEDVTVDGQDNISNVPLNIQPVVLPGGIVMPPPRVESVSTSWKSQHLTHDQVNDYCKKLFVFKTIDVMHFKRWADRRKYVKARKTLQYPPLPEGTKLITIPAAPPAAAGAQPQHNGGKSMKRDWVMNMNGRSYLSVFHEYVRRALQKQPVYKFKQLENAATPYQATVYIGGMQYGVGHGSSKRSAKSAAARASIRILIPEMQMDDPPPDGAAPAGDPDFSFFDSLSISDPRITEFCAATCEPTPHAILRTCLLRNFGAGDKQIHTEIKKLEFQKVELTMKVGKHTATVICKNKKSAKQRASQAILQMLHPHVHSWGSLLRLYGSRSVKSCKEKKLEEQQITLLQDEARHNEPNYAVLDKLKNEMMKLRERDEAVVPIGTMMLREDLPTHSGSNLNNVDL